jgi:hypothetical protein
MFVSLNTLILSRTGEQVDFSAARFQVLTAVLEEEEKNKKKKKMMMMMTKKMMIQVFWDKTSCRLANSCRRFGEARCLVACEPAAALEQ